MTAATGRTGRAGPGGDADGTTQRAAPVVRRVLGQALFELRTTLRNGEQLLLTLVLPVLLLVGLSRTTLVDLGSDDRIGVVAPGVLALAIMSTAFTSQAITMAFDRRTPALRSALALDARFAGSTVRLSPEHHLEVDGPDAPALLAEITAWAHRGDVALTSVATARRSLEDVFLDLTGRSLR